MIIIAVFFAIVYCLISLVNHYHFRTYALDLGAYTNALWDYAHFRWNDSSVFLVMEANLLADHFDLYLVLFSPFVYLFGTYTLLVLQILFVMAGGIGVYRFFASEEPTRPYAIAASLYFYLFFGLLSAISFDYHSNTVAAALLPWLFVFVRRKKRIGATIMFFAILIAKENVSLWIAFVCLGLLIEYRKDKRWRKLLMAGSGLSMTYFVLITFVVMPAISGQASYPHFNYAVLGESPSDAIIFLITNPMQAIQAFFTNHAADPAGDYVKLEFIMLLLVSGLYMLIRKPVYLFMLIPLFFQKFFHDNISMWGFNDQYAVEFAPVMAIGIFSSIATVKRTRIKRMLLFLSLAGCLAASIRIMDNTVMFTDKSRIRIYKAAHYQRNYDVNKVYGALDIIPHDAIVSAQAPFVPHLALRDRIYQFPIIRDAEYIVFSVHELPYPMSEDGFIKMTRDLMASPEWDQVYHEEGFVMLQKRW
jgi:uncharacterized membrane protein